MEQAELMEVCKVERLFAQLDETLAKPLLKDCVYPWEALSKIHDYI